MPERDISPAIGPCRVCGDPRGCNPDGVCPPVDSSPVLGHAVIDDDGVVWVVKGTTWTRYSPSRDAEQLRDALRDIANADRDPATLGAQKPSGDYCVRRARRALDAS